MCIRDSLSFSGDGYMKFYQTYKTVKDDDGKVKEYTLSLIHI